VYVVRLVVYLLNIVFSTSVEFKKYCFDYVLENRARYGFDKKTVTSRKLF